MKSKNKILLLYDATNASTGPAFMKKMKEMGTTIFAPKTEKAAVFGLSKIKLILLRQYNNFTSDKIIPFQTKEEALTYLTS